MGERVMTPPLFDYVCPECGASLEKLEPYTAPAPLCPSCQEATMTRKPSAGTTWHFRGLA